MIKHWRFDLSFETSWRTEISMSCGYAPQVGLEEQKFFRGKIYRESLRTKWSCLKRGNTIGNEDRKVISYSEKYQGNIEELLQ